MNRFATQIYLCASAAALAPLCAVAQPLESIDLDDSCSYFSERLPANVTSFNSNKEAESTIDRIIEASGLSKNFQIRAAGVPNAAAVIQNSVRYVLYNPAFIQSVRASTNNDWAPTSIMAHEIGHHLNGHTLDNGGSRPRLELEADYFSGFILERMGASHDDSRVAMEMLGSDVETPSHPAKVDRLVAISSGWEKACDGDGKCRGTAPQKAPKKKVVEDGPDSCEYSGDGECDEPDLCRKGSDTTDCRITTRRRDQDPVSYPPTQPRGAVAQFCVTPAGSCTMAVPIPVGSICTCYTPVGAFQGVAR